jgi:hypothetical protein
MQSSDPRRGSVSHFDLKVGELSSACRPGGMPGAGVGGASWLASSAADGAGDPALFAALREKHRASVCQEASGPQARARRT